MDAENKAVAVVSQMASSSSQPEKTTQGVLTIKTEADFSKLYNTIDDLTTDANIIIEGKVIQTSSFNWSPPGTNDSVVYTKERIEVQEALGGTAKSGDIITFVEPGGLTTARALGLDKKSDFPKDKIDQQVQVVFNDTPVMLVNQDVFVFGHVPDVNFKNLLGGESYYDILGADQGKLEISGNEVHRHTSQNWVRSIYHYKWVRPNLRV